MAVEKIAIIDLGTNTFHLLIAEINEAEEFVVRGKFKEPVKLGEGGITSGKIAPAAFERGIRALLNYRDLIDSNGVSQVFAYATSAIRSASNGDEFIKTARREANIQIKTINGNEEAALIFDGVRNGVQLSSSEKVLIIDIGGGSVEFVVAHEGQALLLRSLPLGAARLLEHVEPSDPIKEKELDKLDKRIQKELKYLLKELKEFDLDRIVGSSGTFETLASLIAYKNGDLLSAENLNGYQFSADSFNELFPKLIKSNRQSRLKMEGMDPLRVDMIIMGASILKYLLDSLKVKELMTCNFALKEGMLYKYIREKKKRMAQFIGPVDRSIRAKAVKNLATRYKYDEKHALQVAEIATSIFDQLEPHHKMGNTERELLQYASLLHDIGRYIHPSGHHKHGQYIIMNCNLSGFSTNELVLLSNLVRYHRKSLPRRDHYHFSILPDKGKKRVELLAGILRVADNLDRGHRGYVNSLKVQVKSDRVLIEASAGEDIRMEVSHAQVMKDLLERAMGMEVRVSQKEVHGQFRLSI